MRLNPINRLALRSRSIQVYVNKPACTTQVRKVGNGSSASILLPAVPVAFLQCLLEQSFIDSMLHEVATVKVDHRNINLVLLCPHLIGRIIDVLLLVVELCKRKIEVKIWVPTDLSLELVFARYACLHCLHMLVYIP